MFLLAGTIVAGLLPRGAFADNVFKLRGAYSLKLTNAGDGTGISTGPCLAVAAAEEYVNLINNLNNGQGFEVVSELTNQTTYFKLNYSYATYTRSTSPSLEEWHSHGENVSREMFSQADFIIGNSAACYDLETIEQAVLATSMGKMYFMSRGPSRLLELIRDRTSTAAGPAVPHALSIHLSSDEYPREILTQAALRGYKTVAVIHEESDNFFFSDVGKRSEAIVTDVPGLTVCERWSFDPSSTSKAELLEEAVLAAVECNADVLLTSVKNDDMGIILEHLKKHRFRHVFPVVFGVNVAFDHGACGGLLRQCGYAVGATQMAKSQAREFKDGVLGKFSDQSLADYWYGDIAAEISVIVQAIQNVLAWRNVSSSYLSAEDYEAIRQNILLGKSARVLHDVMGQTETLSDWPFETFWGPVTFDSLGQNNGRPATTLQYPYNASNPDAQRAVVIYPQYNVLGEVIDDAWVAPVPGSVSCDYNEYRMYAPDRDGGETCALCAHDCVECPANSEWPSSGVRAARTETCVCRPGFYSPTVNATPNSEMDACLPCPSGSTCKGLSTMPFPKEGHWAPLGEVGVDAMRCISEDNCLGGATLAALSCYSTRENLTACAEKAKKGNDEFGASILCAEGSKGRLCNYCEKGYFYASGEGCLACSSSASLTGSVVVMFVLFGIAIFLAFLVKFSDRCLTDAHGHPMNITQTSFWKVVTNPARFKIVWATAQIIGTLNWATGVVWPEPFATMSSIFSIAQLNFAEVIPAECITVFSFYQQVFCATLVPLGASVGIQTLSCLLPDKILTRGTATYCSLLIAFCVLPSTSLVLFRMFDCVEFQDNSHWLAADLESSCDGETYRAMMAYSIVFLFVYPIGCPLYFFLTLYHKRESIKALDRTKPVPAKLRKYEFLFADYDSNYWHGETYRAIMRVVLSGLVVTFHRSPVVRSFWGVLLAYLFVEITRSYQPYLHAANNAIASAAQYQCFFTYFAAFIIVAEPFSSDNSVLSVILLLVNLVIFYMVFKRAKSEFHSRLKLNKLQEQTNYLAEQLQAFEGALLGIVAVDRAIGQADHKKFLPGGDWCASASKKELIEAAQDMVLDLVGLDQEDELRRFLEIAAKQQVTGTKAIWYWKEDLNKIDAHNPSQVYQNSWIAYADSVAAQLEYNFETCDGSCNGKCSKRPKLQQVASTSCVQIEFDVAGRVISTKGRGKAYGDNSGTKFYVDLEKMVQVNLTSGFERKVFRREVDLEKKPLSTTRMDIHDSKKAHILDDDIPPFPADLVDQRTGDLKEPILRAQLGQLIQIQRKRDDGWNYGFVIFDTTAVKNDANSKDTTPLVNALRHIEAQKKVAKDNVLDQCQFWRGDNVDDDDADDDDGDDSGFSSGWFPEAFTRNPSPLELAEMQASMLSTGGTESEVVDILAPPDTWDSKDNPDPLNVKIIDLAKESDERKEVVSFFKASLRSSRGKLNGIHSVRRIESLSLWQSYKTKFRQLHMRAIAEGKDDTYAEQYEQKWMFHGTTPDVIPKICAQGFNRSFCGRNAVRYGKGVYFANSSNYSNHYSCADSQGIKRMFLCRVAVGEFCLGHNGQLTPDVRDSSRNVLYDTTTDSMDESKRNMFVVYHDAQAYPEYLLEYSMSN